MGWVNPFKHLINYGTLVHSTDAGPEVTPSWGTRRWTSYITFNRRLLSALAKEAATNAFCFRRLFESSCQAAQEVLQSSRFTGYVHIMVPKARLLCCTLQANCLPSNLSSAILWLCGFWQAPYLFKHIKDFDSPALQRHKPEPLQSQLLGLAPQPWSFSAVRLTAIDQVSQVPAALWVITNDENRNEDHQRGTGRLGDSCSLKLCVSKPRTRRVRPCGVYTTRLQKQP